MRFILLFLLTCFIQQAAFGGRWVRNDEFVPYSARLLSEYIQIESVTGNERDAGLFLARVAEEHGFYVNILTDAVDTFNFVASLYPLDSMKPNILLLNHIDVVPACNEEAFTYPPFSGTIADGHVWGRGSIDNKGMAIMQLLAMSQYVEMAKEQNLPYNVTLLSVSNEETGGQKGAGIVADEFLDMLNPVVVFGEGGSGVPDLLESEPDRKAFGISLSFKRRLWIRLTLNVNTSGHGSIPPRRYVVTDKVQTLNNLIKWNRTIEFSDLTRSMFRELGKLEGGFRGLALRNIRLFRPFIIRKMKNDEVVHSLITNTVTITAINTPAGPPNQIPQEIYVILDCRLLPGVETDFFIRQLTRIIDNDNVEIEILHEEPNVPPTVPDQYYDVLADAVREVYPGSGVMPILAPASNDNNYFRAKGLPVYGFMPIHVSLELLESIHNVDERLPIDALIQGTEVYTSMLRQLLTEQPEEKERFWRIKEWREER